MYLTDYHLHSLFSFDGKETMDAICEQAIRTGISEIAITDHQDIYSNQPYDGQLQCISWYQALIRTAQKYEGRLTVRLGAELGQPQVNPDQSKAFLRDYPLDFVIGSIHNMADDIDVGTYDYHRTDIHKVYPEYIQWLIHMVQEYPIDVVGHITYPSRYAEKQTGIRPNLTRYYDQFAELFRTMIQRGIGLELNTSGLARGIGDIMPDMELLKMYQSMGGVLITTGSDAHVTSQIGISAKQGQELLQAAGFRYLTVYEKHRPRMIPLGQDGEV